MHIIPRSSLHILITYSSGRFWLSHNRFSSKNTARLSSKSAFCCSKLFFICSARLCSYKRRDYISISNIYSCHICSLFGETCVSRGWVTLPNPPSLLPLRVICQNKLQQCVIVMLFFTNICACCSHSTCLVTKPFLFLFSFC